VQDFDMLSETLFCSMCASAHPSRIEMKMWILHEQEEGQGRPEHASVETSMGFDI
jgi:hypothetical protein